MTSSTPTASPPQAPDQSSPPPGQPATTTPTYTAIYDQLLAEWPRLIEQMRNGAASSPNGDPLTGTTSDTDPLVGDE